jgi:hypothetical protein
MSAKGCSCSLPAPLQLNAAIFLDTAPCRISRCLLHAGFLLDPFPTLKMEVIRSSETSVHIRTTRRYIPEDWSIRNYRCENLKSCISLRHLQQNNFMLTSLTSIQKRWERKKASKQETVLIKIKLQFSGHICMQIMRTESHRLKMYDNWLPGRIFEPKIVRRDGRYYITKIAIGRNVY